MLVIIITALSACSIAYAAPPGTGPYGLVEIGAKGVKAYSFDLQRANTVAACNQDAETYYRCLAPMVVGTINAEAIVEANLGEVATAVATLRGRLMAERGVPAERITYVGSSGMSTAPHREALVMALRPVIGAGATFEYITAEEEARFAREGLLGMLPRQDRETFDARAVLIDFGSGNIKGSFVQSGNVVTFEIPWGTKRATDEVNRLRGATPFSEYLPNWIDSVFRPVLRRELDHRPAVMNRDRVYLQGGAVYATVNLATPLNRDNMAPIDTSAIGALVERSRRPDALQNLCTQNLDRAVNSEIATICENVFTIPQLQVASSLLQTVATELGFAQKQLRFPRGALLTWPIGYVRNRVGAGADRPCTPTPGVTPCETPDSIAALRIHGSNTIGAELSPRLLEAWVTSRRGTLGEWQRPVPRDGTLGDAPLESRATVSAPAEAGLPALLEVFAHGSDTGIRDLLSNASDIAALSRPLNQSEIAQLQQRGVGNPQGAQAETVIALDGVAVFVQPGLRLRTLTRAEIAGLFRGTIRNWRQLGGPDLAVSVYRRPFGSGTTDTFCSLILEARCSAVPGQPNAMLICDTAEPTSCTLAAGEAIEDNRVLSDKVSSTRGGVGYGGIAYIENNNPVVVNECGLGYPPAAFYVKSGEFPYARKLLTYRLPDTRNLWVEPFLAFAKSERAVPAIDAAGFVSQAIEIGDEEIREFRLAALANEAVNSPTRGQDERREMARLGELAKRARRLSATFRFAFGKADINQTAEDELSRLVGFMQKPDHVGRLAHVVGFASAPGDDGPNLLLSRNRASQVANWLRGRGVRVGEVFGVGENLHVACQTPGDPALSRGRLNQRVEIWME